MDRRGFVRTLGAGTLSALLPQPSRAAAASGSPSDAHAAAWDRTLFLIELKGGNDGLNTVVPYAQDAYYRLRPRLAIARDEVLRLGPDTGLHPALRPLLPVWGAGELAIIQGLGYPDPNLSHFRSIEIWDTASGASEVRSEGWLARAFAAQPPPQDFAADGIVIGSADPGPFAGTHARTIVLTDPERFRRQARLARPGADTRNPALAHVMKVETDLARAAARLGERAPTLRTAFPRSPFGNAVRTASETIGSGARAAVFRITLNGFDTHQNQPGIQAGLLAQLAEGLAALRAALVELGRWDRTLILTYAEFGRRPAENGSSGTDHGTANAHFVLGGRVRGEFYGEAPRLDRLDAGGNLPFATDFRSLYATVLEHWWGIPAGPVLGARFQTMPIVG